MTPGGREATDLEEEGRNIAIQPCRLTLISCRGSRRGPRWVEASSSHRGSGMYLVPRMR